MGSLVAAVAMTHNPRMFWNAEAASDDDRSAVRGAFDVGRKAIRDASPDVVLVIGNDHMDQFSYDNLPGFSVALGNRMEGPFWYEDEIMRLPSYSAPVHTALAMDVLHGAYESGFEPSRTESYRVDHAFTIPLDAMLPDAGVPVVPVFTNTFGPPLPSSRRCHAFGKMIREVIDGRPEGERVAVVGSFNLSVDVGGPKMGQRSTGFDERVLAMIEAGESDRLVEELEPHRLVRHGNSTAEFLNYQATLGVVGDRKPDFVWYRLVQGWGGCPIVVWSTL